MAKYIHSNKKRNGNVVVNSNYSFPVVNGEVEVLDDNRPYNELAKYGFVYTPEKEVVVFPRTIVTTPTVKNNANSSTDTNTGA